MQPGILQLPYGTIISRDRLYYPSGEDNHPEWNFIAAKSGDYCALLANDEQGLSGSLMRTSVQSKPVRFFNLHIWNKQTTTHVPSGIEYFVERQYVKESWHP